MDRQTQINGGPAAEAPGRRFVENAGELWHHTLLLGELQVRLLSAELRAGLRQARLGAVLLVAGLALGLGTIPIILTALALVLLETSGTTPAVAFGVIAGVAVAIACALAIVGGWHLKSRRLGLSRTRSEWDLNWRWFKEFLGGDRAARDRRASRAPH